jgi:hypothetical protein
MSISRDFDAFFHLYPFEPFFVCGGPTIELDMLAVTCGYNLRITKRITQIGQQCKML